MGTVDHVNPKVSIGVSVLNDAYVLLVSIVRVFPALVLHCARRRNVVFGRIISISSLARHTFILRPTLFVCD